MKKLTNLLVAALLASATMVSAHDLPYEQDDGFPDDPVPTVDAADLGGQGVPIPRPAGDLGGEPSLNDSSDTWSALLMGLIMFLPNRSQIL